MFSTFNMTPWMEDRPIARRLHKQGNTETEIAPTNIHAPSWIRTHYYSVRGGEDNMRLCPGVHWYCHYYYLGFEVLTAAVKKGSISWNITPCSLFKVNGSFGGICHLHLQGRRISQARNQREAGGKESSHQFFFLQKEQRQIGRWMAGLNYSFIYLFKLNALIYT
jgi:hypothetical protein